jgi:hypothetical protein
MSVLQGFVGSAYSPQSPNVDNQVLMNWYLERSESPRAKVPNCLLPTPGFNGFAILPGADSVCGLFSQNDRTFAVGGGKLYEISRQGVITERVMTTLNKPDPPTVTQSPLTPALATPNTPVITHGGALGTTTYGYQVTALNALGETDGSLVGSSPYGNASLSATNYNQIRWDAVTNATGYKIYRTTPGTPVLVAIVGPGVLTLLDLGAAGTAATAPVSNTTGGVAGTTTYGYKVSATLGLGETVTGPEGITATGPAVLSPSAYNILTWAAIANANGYNIYRTTGGVSPPVLIGSSNTPTFNDVGLPGVPMTPPVADTTGTGVIVDDGTPCSISSSGTVGHQLLIVSGNQAAVFDLDTNALAVVKRGATMGGYIGGYFVILDASESKLWVSELLDGFTWDPTQYAERLAAGDTWLAMAVTFNEVWLFGSQTTEVWVPTGDADTRFAPYTSVFIEQGIIAPGSLARINSTLMWLGQNKEGAGIVWRTNGYTPVQVSTRGIEKALERFAVLADARAFSYTQQGHSFYVLTFPSDDDTWVYDTLTNEWHQRGEWDENQGQFLAYRAQCHTFAFGGLGFGIHLVGDRESGVIASLNLLETEEMDGVRRIRRVRRSPHVANEAHRIFFSNFVLDLEVGLGISSGQGSNPAVMLRYSNDGGKSWSAERWRTAGRQGAWKQRVIWNRCGSGRDRVWELVVTDPIPWRVAAAYFNHDEAAA